MGRLAQKLPDRAPEHSGALKLIHRDLSPQNVLLSYTGGVKISDFGIAQGVHINSTSPSRQGKYSYFSPEVVNGAPQSPLSDIFAVGVILWEMLAGRRLFQGRSDAETLKRVASCEVPEIARDLHPDMVRFVETLLHPNPAQRFQTADAALSMIYGLPKYSHDSRDLERMLAFLFPDPELRFLSPSQAPNVMQQMSGPIQHDLGYPVPMEPSLHVAIDLHTREMVPFWPSMVERKPRADMGLADWLQWWKRRGVVRDDEVSRDPTRTAE